MAGGADLPGLSLLFSEAWMLYRARFGVLMAAMAIGSAAAMAAFLLPLGAVYLWGGWDAGWPAWAAAAAAGLTAGLWISGWLQAVLAEALLRPEASAAACWKDSWPKIVPLTWVCLLYLLAVFGGLYFFILPGVYLAVGLVFAPLVCAAEGRGGAACFYESLRLSEGRWGAVCACLLAAGGASSLPGLVPVAGPVLSAAAAPFSFALLVTLYRRLGPGARVGGPGPWPRAALWAAGGGFFIASYLTWRSLMTIRQNWPMMIEAMRASAEMALELVP